MSKSKGKAATSPHGMVSTASPWATEAGVEMLEKGGNAVDAAVAAAFCLGVTEPQASGLGGQSMILLHRAAGGDPLTIALDGSSRAPFGVDPTRLPGQPLKQGLRSATVPSTPAALGYLLETYGTLPLEEVLRPSIRAAEEGFRLSALQHTLLCRESQHLRQDEGVLSVFFREGAPRKAGETVRQPQLAACLGQMAGKGWRDFYLGGIGERILQDMEDRGGWISQVDLSKVPLPVQREPLKGSYRGYGLETFPPPGAGRALFQILNILEGFTPRELAPDTPRFYLILALAFHAALMNRERFPVDPVLYPQMPDRRMTGKDNAAPIVRRIRKVLQLPEGEGFSPPPTAGETTHLSVADAAGNMVGITQSIELVFGSKTMASGLGFFYNNYMSAFNYKDMMHPYYLVPGGRPYSSVAPTLVRRGDGRPHLLLGSPGSERISTALSQVLTRVLDAGQDLEGAIRAPRLHAGSVRKVMVERGIHRPEVVEALEDAGFQVSDRGPSSFYMGCVQAVELPEAGGGSFAGVSDPRRDGTARGPAAGKRTLGPANGKAE
ncbi:gamma-glutamyltransferase family protein [Anaerotalea alkaliphila]|uniref:Gamma-glutamyltransferase n=1 Tax=Anaerotalea alkaliphila TaxID=2662126 RepID=A0A7X5HWG4_9FIRM|nr:gamma-glutamyltransferase [Anaerotalea alkaliphila]NDL67866.1 gamma-glutamyltransferase [Anaerotalea alkaliphila]